MKWLYYQNYVKLWSQNSLKLNFANVGGFALIQSVLSFYLNLTVLTFLLYVEETRKIGCSSFIISGYISLINKDSINHIMVLQFMWSNDFLLHGTNNPRKLFWIVIYSFDWLYFTQCLTSFSLLITTLFFKHGFWCYFI